MRRDKDEGAVRLSHPAIALLLSATLVGCTFGGSEESSGVDKGAYRGGLGVALAVVNGAEESFEVTVRVLGVGNVELARFDERLDAGRSIEKWYSLDKHGLYSARLAYEFQGSGRSASGEEDQTVDTSQCTAVTRIAWELRQEGGQVGSALLDRSCVDDATNETR